MKRPGLSARSTSIAAAMSAAASASEEAPAPSSEKIKPIGLTLRLEPPIHDQLRKIAFDERTSIHSLLLEAVDHVIRTRSA